MNGHKIRQEIFSSLPCTDGRGSILDWDGKKLDKPWTQEYRNEYIKNVYANSCIALGYKILQPVTVSHKDADPYLKGKVSEFYLEERHDPCLHYVLVCDELVNDDLYEAIEDGRLPGCSAEISAYADLTAYGDGWLGDYVSAVTYNGSAPVAQPFLDRRNATLDEMQSPVVYSFTRLPKPRQFQVSPHGVESESKPEEKKGMTPEEKAALAAEIKAAIMDEIKALLASKEDADMTAKMAAEEEKKKVELAAQTPAKEPDATDTAIAAMTAKFAALEKELATERAATAFAKLGLDESAHKKDFDSLAAVAGLDMAVKQFTALKGAMDQVTDLKKSNGSVTKAGPPMGSMIKQNPADPAKFEVDKTSAAFKAIQSIEKDPAIAEEIARRMAAKELAAATGGK